MATGKNTPLGNTYAVTERDTTAVYGNAGAAPNPVHGVSTFDSTAPANTPGGSATWNENSAYFNGVVEPDTSATNGEGSTRASIHEADVSGMIDTTIPSIGGTPSEVQPYREGVSLAGFPASIADTTLTSRAPGGSTAPVGTGRSYTVTEIDTMSFGSPAQGGPLPGKALAATMAAPTVASGSRSVKVSWTAAADPAGDKVLGYMVLGYPGGTYWAGRGATSLIADEVDPDRDYKFAVSAITRAGTAPLSPLSAAVQAYNPDAADKLKPAGIAPENKIDPIYKPDGTTVDVD